MKGVYRLVVVVSTIMILSLYCCSAQTTWITLEDVVLNNGLTDEVAVGDILRIDVTISSYGAPQPVNITVGVNIYNSTSLIITDNVTDEILQNEEKTYSFNFRREFISGYYTAEAFVLYNQNGTNISIKENVTFKVVSISPVSLDLFHEDVAPEEVALFLQNISNNGVVPANVTVKVWIEYDDPSTTDSPDYAWATHPPTTSVIPNGTSYVVKVPWKVPDTIKGCEYTNDSRYTVYSELKYGLREISPVNTTSINVVYMEVNTESYGVNYYYSGLDEVEVAPGEDVSGKIELLNRDYYPVVVHEVRAWVEDSAGNIIVDLSPTDLLLNISGNAYVDNTIPGHGADCADLTNLTIARRGSLSFSFKGKIPEDISLDEYYKVVFAVDYGVPRSYLEGNPWNILQSYQFRVVKAEVLNISIADEIAPGTVQDITGIIKNVGTNVIENANVILEIVDSSGNEVKNFTTVLQNIGGKETVNLSFIWEVPPDIGLGEYTATLKVYYGSGSYHSMSKNFRIVRLGIINISAPPVAPYETTNITVKIENQAPVNATLKYIDLKIKGNKTLNLGTYRDIIIENNSIKQINFSFYFDPKGWSNGTFDVETSIEYGNGVNFTKSAKITLLPVGIKEFKVPEIGVANVTFYATAYVQNIANSNVSVTFNLTVNGTQYNITTIDIPANSTFFVDIPVNLTSGFYNIILYINYSTLPEEISRSRFIRIYDTGVELSIQKDDVVVQPSVPTEGETVKIEATIYNTGVIDAENVLVELFVDSRLYENKTINITSNSSSKVTFYWKNVRAGTHNITIRVDYDNKFAEKNESNNIVNISITVRSAQTVYVGAGVGGVGKEKPIVDVGITSVDYLFIKKFVEEYKLSDKTFYKAPKNIYPILALVDKPVFVEEIEAKNVVEVEGDIYEIANKIILEEFKYARTVILARGDIPADAAAAIAFAKLNRYPILLTKPDKLVSSALLAIEELSPRKIIIVGGEKAISKEIEEKLKKRYDVERIYGKTRYETAVELAKAYKKRKLDIKVVVVTDGRNISEKAVLIAAYMNAPIIYVKDSVPESVLEFLKNNRVDKDRKPIRLIAVDISNRAERQISEIFSEILPAEIEVIVENLDDDDLYVDIFVNKYSKTMHVKSGRTKNYGVFKIKDKEITIKARWLDPDLFEKKLLEKTITIKVEPGKRKVVWIKIERN